RKRRRRYPGSTRFTTRLCACGIGEWTPDGPAGLRGDVKQAKDELPGTNPIPGSVMNNAATMQLGELSEEALRDLAQALAPRLRAGDFLALSGDLGAGKTTFARFLIRALVEREDEEVPSPTFSLVQPYETPRFAIHHFDFYRLSGPDAAAELGVEEALAAGIVIAEWPDRLQGRLPADRLDITFAEEQQADRRRVTLEGRGSWGSRLDRFLTIRRFIEQAGWSDANPSYLNGDASVRGYTRLRRQDGSALMMDWPRAPDGPPIRGNRPYSQIAHLAEDVRPFMAIAAALSWTGLAAPEITVWDMTFGLLLLEDFGDLTFTRLAGEGADLAPLYRTAVDALLILRGRPPEPVLSSGGATHILPDYDREALCIETELVPDWLLPAISGHETPSELRTEFSALWAEQFDWLVKQPTGWVLRDFHSPNLIWRPERQGLARLGIIDFQDALRGHPAYDLVSLLQDARLDLPGGLEAELLTYYCDEAAKAEPGFDRTGFLRAYHLLGAQRATKILGIFTRLARRDGKRAYLQHMPRVARYLAANLADPDLAKLKSWYEREVPQELEGIAARL
ncbi:MAG: tRNA (adenosine(37)-N6)-threonylcarbamoyltransferase complex ATPase subunit type 1 TsaE, partial [Rhodomicrobiaceae bacterium]